MFLWYDLQIRARQGAWKGNKECPTANCDGFLSLTAETHKKVKSGETVTVPCLRCQESYCWVCLGQAHPRHSCVGSKNVTSRWMSFLKTMMESSDASDSSASTTTANNNSNSNNVIGTVTQLGFDPSLLASALLKFEQAIDDTKYFRTQIETGNLKKCPACRRLIEKMEGCDSMVCGRNSDGGNQQAGCGFTFQW